MSPVSKAGDLVRGAAAGFRLARGIYAPPDPAAPARTPADLGLRFEDRSFRTSRDGLAVSAWFVPGKGPAAVLVAHGMRHSRESVLDHIGMLHRAGFSVLAYDSRNHGATGRGRRTWRMATRFTDDLIDALAQLRREVGTQVRVGVLAFSFSCWPALRAARGEGAAIDALVCDSGPVPNIGAGVARLARLASITMPPGLRDGTGLAALQSSARFWALARLHQPHWPLTQDGPPVLFVAGGRDGVLPAEEISQLARVTPGSSTWIVPRAGHLRALRVAPEEYARRVCGFLHTGLDDPEVADA